jgi:RNA polymerase sigma-70 factor (ECF subfamily)
MLVTPEDEIEVLLARLADGDRSVFSLVFKRLQVPMHRFCLSMLKHEADAADATQQAMAKIFERASDYDPKRPAMPWALAIAAWECRTLQRKRFRRREAPEDAGREPADDRSEEDLIRRDLTQAALTAMSELPETDRETLLATFLDESTTVSGATLRKRRERALDRLRAAFRRLYGLD